MDDISSLQTRVSVHDALTRARSLREGDTVQVSAPRYHGSGIVSTHRSHYDSHIVWLDEEGPCVNVLLENGNAWLYPALCVMRARV